jgi:Ca2+-binding EF-hand superfamily protein
MDGRPRSSNNAASSSSCIACGAGGYKLPKKIRREVLDELTAGTKLKDKEVKALYSRFRRLAPDGYLMPEGFRQTMGAIGLTDDSFLPERMFQVFDSDNDGQLSFTEFATSLAVMIRGEEAEKLKLSYKMAAGSNSNGIALEDFRKLIRACSNTMSSLVAPPSSITSDEEIDRLFNDMSSADEADFSASEGGFAASGQRMISLAAYQEAAQSNEEFLQCLGLDYTGKNRYRDGHDRFDSRAERKRAQLTTLSGDGALVKSQDELSTNGDITYAVSKRSISKEFSAVSHQREKGIFVPQDKINELKDRIDKLQKAIKAANLQEQSTTRERSSGGGGQQPAAPPQDPISSRWWPFQKCTLPMTEEGVVTSPMHKESSMEKSFWSQVEEESNPLPKQVPALVLDRIPNTSPSAASNVASTCELLASTSSLGDEVGNVGAELDKVLNWALEIDGTNEYTTAETSDDGIGVRALDQKGLCGAPALTDEDIRRRSSPKPRSQALTKANTNITLGSGLGIIRGTTRIQTNVATRNGRQRKRHRLLGPKKGLAVHFGHENWNMVLSMMIGIRMSVGRSKHEATREIQPIDFQMKEKFSILPRLANVFDTSVGKRVQMTRFYDYAPVVFQRIRNTFGINHDDYVKSIGPEQLLGNLVLGNLASLSELSSEGKSGAFFYYTADGNFMIKTVAPKEQRLLKNMLKRYYEHIMKFPGTLIVRFLGLHCLRVFKQSKYFGYDRKGSTRKVYFIVMANMFNTPFEIHRRYDLKGSWVGRSTSEEEGKDPTVALKDVDFEKQKEKIRVGKDLKDKLVQQIEVDSAFLAQNNIIDYSLLVGISDMPDDDEYGNNRSMDNDSDKGSNFEEQIAARIAKPKTPKIQVEGEASTITSVFAAERTLTETGSVADTGDKANMTVPVHQRDSGGMISSDRRHLYYIGIIDILTPYDTFKVFEHYVKAIRHEWKGVSCCPPPFYSERFNKFLRDAFE